MPITFEKSHGFIIAVALSLSTVIACFAPRFLGLLPAILGVIGFLSYRPAFGNWPALSRSVLGWLFGVVALMGLSTLWSIDQEIASERAIKVAILFLGGALLLNLNIERLKDPFQKYFPLILGLASLILAFELFTEGFIYKLVNPWPDPSKMYRGGLNMSNYNRAAVFVTLCIWPALAILRSDRSKQLIPWVLGALMLLIVFKTESQSAQLAFLAGALVYWLFPLRQSWIWYGIITVILAVMWAIPWVMPFFYDYFPAKIVNLSWFRTSYAPERLEVWDFISRRVQENPLYGFGVEATRATTDFDTDRLFYEAPTVLHPHNFMLQFWIEFGALGIAFLTAFLTKLILYFKALPTQVGRLYLATFASVLSTASTGYGLWQGWWLGSLFLIAMFCMITSVILSEKDKVW